MLNKSVSKIYELVQMPLYMAKYSIEKNIPCKNDGVISKRLVVDQISWRIIPPTIPKVTTNTTFFCLLTGAKVSSQENIFPSIDFADNTRCSY